MREKQAGCKQKVVSTTSANMKTLAFTLVCLVSFISTLPSRPFKDVYMKDEEIEVIRYHKGETIPEKEYYYFGRNSLKLYGFSWSNCAKDSDLTINKLTIVPNPIEVPGNVTVALDATIKTEIKSISSAELVVKKKIFGVYVEVPCVDNVGSCTYNDICSLLKNITCPKILTDMGFTCTCPFVAKHYEIPDGTLIPIPNLPIPPSISNGDYDIKVTLKDGSTTLACYEVKASLNTTGKLIITKK